MTASGVAPAGGEDLSTSPLVVMGVSGSGKSLIGALLARALGRPFVDGDSLHPAANVAKMSSGRPLDDVDRMPWLDAVAATLVDGTVVACSALRRAYRDRIRAGVPDAVFIQLNADAGLIAQRMASREGHFMPVSLLASQLAAFEPLQTGEPGVVVDVAASPDVVLARAMTFLLGQRSCAS